MLYVQATLEMLAYIIKTTPNIHGLMRYLMQEKMQNALLECPPRKS